MQRAFAHRGLRVVVDLSLCGARHANYARDGSAASDPRLVHEYGLVEVEGRCAVDLALLQMQQAGVEIVQSYNWARPPLGRMTAAFGKAAVTQG